VNNGAFHEGLNMAGIWKLPALFICENNQYATEVPFSYSSGSPDVGSRAEIYGLAGVIVDGNDVLAVHESTRLAVERARSGQGATLIECKTYRTRPHAEGMGDFTYRTREEVGQWKERCPIATFRQKLIEEHGVPVAELQRIDDEIAAEVADAKNFAQASDWPAADSATTHIYAAPRSVSAPSPAHGERVITYSQATLEALGGEMARNGKIFVLGEGIGVRGGNFKTTEGLYAKFGGVRLCDTPICERGFVGLAGGAAMTGTRPVVDFMFADFVLDGLGEIINQIAKMQYMSSGRLKMPVLLRGCIGIGHSAATHHSGSYHALLAQVPGLRVVVPSSPYDAKGLLLHALRSDDPVVFLEHRELLNLKGPVPAEDYEIEFGRASVVRAGTTVTVVALARMVQLALSVCDELAAAGISVELIDPRTVSPLDSETILASVAKTGRLLIVEETPAALGLGAEIAARVADAGFDDLDAPIKRLNGQFAPTPYSPPLEAAVIPSASSISVAIRALVEE
jgi:2-oxoisovalerate dehydrogenase E1 component